MFPFTALKRPESLDQERGEIIYTATQFYSPDVVDAWVGFLERKMAFFRVQLTWRYVNGQFAQVRTELWEEEVIEEIELTGCTLENFAQGYKSEERPH